MGKLLGKYFIKRNEAFQISNIIDTGYSLIHTTDSMGNKKIIKPSEYEIDGFIDSCIKSKQELIKIISQYNNDNIIPVEYVNQINDLKINKLKDCKRLGEFYITIGKLIKSYVSYNMLLAPLGIVFRLNLLEGLFIMIIILIGFLLKLI